MIALTLIYACLLSPLNQVELDLLEQGYSQESIDLAYLIGDETGDYNFVDAGSN